MFGLTGKIVVVTGANRGIGKSLVEYLSENGVICVNISKSECKDDTVISYVANMKNKLEVKNVINKIESEIGPIYGVVVNAGINKDNLFNNISEDDWQDVIGTNLTGAYNLISAILPLLQLRKMGSIVAVSSIIGEEGNIGQANYAASKAGLLGLIKSLAKESARSGVRLNTVSPGYTNTEMVLTIGESERKKIVKKIPLRRFAEPVEIAYPIAFLLSPKLSSFITGENIRVNGGQLM